MSPVPCDYRDIDERFFGYLPVVCVPFDEARNDDKQEDEHVDWSEDLVDPGWFLHSKRQEPWTGATMAECKTEHDESFS